MCVPPARASTAHLDLFGMGQTVEDKVDKAVDMHNGLQLFDLGVTLSRLGLQDFTLIAKPVRMSAPQSTIEVAGQQKI